MASQQGGVQVLAQFGGGWLQCADAQGVLYYNSQTQQASRAPPPGVAGASAAQPAAQPPAQQATVKMTLGEWQVCEDVQGEYYVHTTTGQTFDQPPPQLVQLYQSMQSTPAQAAPVQYAAAPAVKYAAAPQQYSAVQHQYAAVQQQQYAAAAMQQYAAAPQQYAAAPQHFATTSPHYGAAQYGAAQAQYASRY